MAADVDSDGIPYPQFVGEVSSALCSLLARPILITGMFREVLSNHFSSAAFIEQPELRHLIWQTGETSSILIEAIHRWNPQMTELRPGIIIKRNSYANHRVGINDKSQGNPGDRQGNPHFATYWIGSHTLFCIGGSGGQAEVLSTEVQRELTEFGPLIREAMQLHRFQVTEVGAVSELEEAQENFVVPVTVGYAYEQKWTLRQQSPTLKTISLAVLLDP
jgi:hypothetical protein